MKLVEITIILSAPDDTSDRDVDAMVEAYEDLM